LLESLPFLPPYISYILFLYLFISGVPKPIAYNGWRI
jgi:hypothetical protein